MIHRDENLTVQLVEAILFLENRPVNIKYISKIAGKSKETILQAIAILSERLKETGSSLYILENDKGDYHLAILPSLYEKLGKNYDMWKKLGLSNQALETLAIIAYRQPTTRIDIEKIRGVGVEHLLRLLLEHDLIRILGKKNAPGRPVLYGTTDKFLKYFGLLSLKDLPSLSEFERT